MPEEEAKIGPGTVIEVDAEQMFVSAIDPGSNTLTVTHGYAGTTATTHATGTMMVVAPRYTRTHILRAVADGVDSLFPDLFSVNTALAVDQGGGIADLADPACSHVLSAHALADTGEWLDVPATLLPNFPEVQTGPAIQVGFWSYDVYVTYARRFIRPTTESDDLQDDCYVDAQWEKIVKVAAMAELISTGDIDATTARYLTEQLNAQGVPVGSLTDLSVGLLRYRGLLMEEAKRNLRRTHQPGMRMRSPGVWSGGRMT